MSSICGMNCVSFCDNLSIPFNVGKSLSAIVRARSSLATVSPDHPNSWFPIAINPTAWDVLSNLFFNVCSLFSVILLMILAL